MNSSFGAAKKRTSLSTSFINTTNPEVFQIHPRPGGILPIDLTLKYSDFKTSNLKTSSKIGKDLVVPPDFKLSVNEKISKEFRVQTALDETASLDSQDATVPNPLKDAMYTLGVTISGLVMLASNHPNIPEDHLRWTAHCLECIKDDFGNHPPNVQGILNHIKNSHEKGGEISDLDKTQEEGKSAIEEEGGTEEEGAEGEEVEKGEGAQTVKTTTRVRMGSKDEDQ